MRRVALIALCVLTLACGGDDRPAPTETPGTMDDAIAELVRNGVAVHKLVGGDAGCPEQDLHDNSLRLEVSIGTMSSTRTIYLMRWRRQTDFDAAAESFATCVAEFGDRTVADRIDEVANAPWRAYGPNWPDQLRIAVTDALNAVGSQ